MSYSRIPAELRALKQWVLWDKDKIPHQVNGRKADVTDPSTWNTFDNCCRVGGYNGIGLVFSVDDSYTGIDLDSGGDATTQLDIFNAMNSYSEISPSGKGLHIIVKGTVPSSVRKGKIEVYSSGRYFTMTGNVYPSNSEKSIRECQFELMQLWEQLGGTNEVISTQITGTSDATSADEQIIAIAKSAANGELFDNLYKGKWQGLYPSQSEGDQALMNLIVFYRKLAQHSEEHCFVNLWYSAR